VSGLSVCFLASYLGILASSHLSEISSLPFFSFSLSGYARSKTFIIFACFCFAWVKEQPKAFHIWNEGQKFPSLKSGISTQLAHLEERSQSLRKALIEAQHSSRSSYVLKVKFLTCRHALLQLRDKWSLIKNTCRDQIKPGIDFYAYMYRGSTCIMTHVQTASKYNSMITQVRSV
jgi:hypothetical protein